MECHFFEETLLSLQAYIGIGFAGFSGPMAISRFMGDSIITKFPPKIILVSCLIIAMLGIISYSISHMVWWSVVSIYVTRIGCSMIAPIVFHKAGHKENVPPGLGLAIISTLG